MVVQTRATPAPVSTLQRQFGPALLGIALVAVSFFVLVAIDRGMLFFPVWSSIAYPALAVSPFVVLSLRMPVQLKAFLILLVVLVLIPFLGMEDTFYLELAIQIGILAVLALGLNIVIGFAGLLDLGYVAFFAVGAYLWGIFSASQADTIVKLNHALASPEAFWLFLFGGIGVAAVFGILLGLPVLRLRGDYLAIVTLGFGEMIRVLVSNLGNVSGNPDTVINITNGAQGLPGIASPPLPVFIFDAVAGLTNLLGLRVPNIQALTYQLFFYFLVLLVGLLAVLMISRLENSPIGRAWTAIREDETAAIAMGVPLVRMKLLAFATGASFAGAMGVIFAAKQTFVSPESFSFDQSIFILSIVIVGGMGSIRGVILGAVAVTLLNVQTLPNLSIMINSLRNNPQVSEGIRALVRSWPAQLEPAKYQRFVFGILLIIMMIFRPEGILPAGRRKLEIQEAMKRGEAAPPDLVEAPPAPAITETGTGETPHAAGN
jgi:branched-chain amino acid transport system permease protein